MRGMTTGSGQLGMAMIELLASLILWALLPFVSSWHPPSMFYWENVSLSGNLCWAIAIQPLILMGAPRTIRESGHGYGTIQVGGKVPRRGTRSKRGTRGR